MSSTLSEGQKLIQKPLRSPFKERSENDKVSFKYFGFEESIQLFCHTLEQTCPKQGLQDKVGLC